MTPFWLWVSVGCVACGLLGFSAVRLGARRSSSEDAAAPPSAREIAWQSAAPAPAPAREIAWQSAAAPAPARTISGAQAAAEASTPERETPWPPQPRVPPAVVRGSALRERPATPTPARTGEAAGGSQPAAAGPQPVPAPTGPRPEAAKLALWARQVKAGERKMSIATDGCRVTWNRTCKHGHPSWLVHLGYLKRNPLQRHTPR